MFRAASVHDSKMSKVLKRQGEQIHQGAWKALENNSRCQPDGCRSWLVCAASLLSVVVVSGIAFSYGLLLPSLMDAFEATRQETAFRKMAVSSCWYCGLSASYWHVCLLSNHSRFTQYVWMAGDNDRIRNLVLFLRIECNCICNS